MNITVFTIGSEPHFGHFIIITKTQYYWAITTCTTLPAGHYKEDSETLPWLKQLATDSQENERVRGAAVYALASYKNDTDVYVWLKQFLPSAPFSSQKDAVFGWEASDFRTGKEIDDDYVQQVATALNLPEETIRRCYEQLAEEYKILGFKLSWVTEVR